MDELLDRFAAGDARAGRKIIELGQQPSTPKDSIDALLDGLAKMAAKDKSIGARDALVAILFAQPFLRAEVYRIVIREVEAEEVIQEALMRISRGVSDFRGDAKVRTWARAVAHNAAVGQIRRRSESVGASADVAEEPGEVERFSSVLASRADVQSALAQLPDDFGIVVRLRDLEHLTYQQIAERLDLNLNTVRSRLARGRARLAVLLDQP